MYVARLQSLERRHHALLNREELARCARFHRDADRDRFTLGGVLLRAAIGALAGVQPSTINVDRTCERCGAPHGPPQVDGVGLEASISHSGDFVAVALTAAGPVGVDVEVVSSRQYSSLLASVCTAAERMYVRSTNDFYIYWTRKEAVLKATRDGLRRPMTDLMVTTPEDRPRLVTMVGGAPPCRMADIAPGKGYVGAVAVLTDEPVRFTVVDGAQVLSVPMTATSS